MADGDSATLETKTDLQEDDKVQWWYQDDGNLIAEISRVGVTREVTHDGFDERFRSKLVLNDKTGSLTINNTMNIHSGLYMLQISSKTRRIKKKFILTVTSEYINNPAMCVKFKKILTQSAIYFLFIFFFGASKPKLYN